MSTLQPNSISIILKYSHLFLTRHFFSHVKKTSLNFYKSLSFIASYICICVVIKAIILGHDLLICQLQSQPSRVCLLMSHSSSHPHLFKCRVPFSCCCFSVSARAQDDQSQCFACSLQFPEMCDVILPPLVTGSAATERETGNGCKSIIIILE